MLIKFETRQTFSNTFYSQDSLAYKLIKSLANVALFHRYFILQNSVLLMWHCVFLVVFFFFKGFSDGTHCRFLTFKHCLALSFTLCLVTFYLEVVRIFFIFSMSHFFVFSLFLIFLQLI